jgi:LPS-assembly protein
MRFARLSALLILVSFVAHAQESPTSGLLEGLQSNINIEGLETSYDPATQIATATGDVHIKYGDTEIAANRADYNASTGDVKATGNVTVIKAGATYKGESLVYNVQTGELHGNAVRSSMIHEHGTLLYSLNDLDTETKTVERIDGNDAFFTTHDLANPNYKIKARTMTIYPNDRIVMKNVKVYAGKTPIFWLPYLSQPLDDEIGYKFTPGYSDLWGAYLLNQYGVIHGDHTLAQYKLDLRSTRGVAVGADFISLKQKDNQQWGKIKFYYAFDADPTLSQAREDRSNTPEGRYRINFQHRIYITGPAERTWYVDFDINKMSDEFFYEDFFFEEYRTQREPDNQVSLVRSDPRYTATLMTKFQLNDFYRTDTRLPELAFDFTRQPVFNSGFFYQGNSSFGILEEKRGSRENTDAELVLDSADAFLKTEGGDLGQTARRVLGLDPLAALTGDEVQPAMDALRASLSDVGFSRLHTYHEVLYPKTVFGWLTLVPRLGIGYQSYSSIDGGPKGLSSDSRALFHAGFDASFKVSKTWDDVQSERMGLDGLKHTVQPYINYSYLNADDISGLPAIDRNVPTTRPRPLDIPFYTGIDSLRSWNAARIGVRNLLQTRRDYASYSEDEDGHFRAANSSAQQTYNWAGLNTYVDLFVEDPEFNRDVSNLFNELFWRPLPWLTFWADTQLPIGGGEANFTEANYGITWMANKSLSVTLGHQYITDHPFFENSSLVYSRLYARLNENWGVSMNHVYEMDDNTLEYQSYSVHRDLNSWVASLGALVRDNRGVTDMGLIFSMTLKEFPQVSIPLDTDPNPTGRGGKR